MISTRNLDALPTIENLRRLTRSLATLDAVLMPDWQWRYYSYNSNWSAGETMASMRDGSGDSYFILFSEAGVVIGGRGHESAVAAAMADGGLQLPGIIDAIPAVFERFVNEPAFSVSEMTFCLWRKAGSTAWEVGPVELLEGHDPDGSEGLLYILDGKPETYAAWAKEYYEVEVDIDAVRRIYEHTPLSNELVSLLNPEVTIDDLAEDIAEIGYPVSR